MITEKRKNPLKRFRDLQAKRVMDEKSRNVKGGPCPGTNTNPTRLNSTG